MPSGLAVLGTLVGGVILGVVFSPAPVPETHVIKVHEPAKVITKKVVETETIHAKLPESCVSYLDRVGKIEDESNRIKNQGDDAYDVVDQIDVQVLDGTTSAIRVEERLNNILSRMDEDLQTLFAYNADLKQILQQCKSEQQDH